MQTPVNTKINLQGNVSKFSVICFPSLFDVLFYFYYMEIHEKPEKRKLTHDEIKNFPLFLFFLFYI